MCTELMNSEILVSKNFGIKQIFDEELQCYAKYTQKLIV